MAEAFLKMVLENLSSLIKDEIGLIKGVDEEMKKLFSTFTTIQAVLEDAEIKKVKDKAIENWLCKLKDLAYELDDIMDECATHVSKLKLKNTKLSCKKPLFRIKIARRIKHIAEKLDVVAGERAKFHLREITTVERSREVDAMRVTSSILNVSHQVYGRDEDKENIVGTLVNGVIENQHISVLPILGVGGLGKTTLAQSVYNDQRVVNHFEKRLWVCVSDNFDRETLVRAMIESATKSGSASDLKQLDTLEHHLWELLEGKRYLLVLDDVWNEHQEKWSLLKTILACGSNGTFIIVTTRLKMVANRMGTRPLYYLKHLSEDDCWMLMKERAFAEEEKDKYLNLEDIGKQIVKKCAGVPMAAKSLGGLLRFKRTENEWIYVKESELWNLPQEEPFILPALRLSYHHLPLELRQCFAYFAVFPKDFSIRKEELIFHWMAQGYISTKGTLQVEDVGNQMCNDLVLRSLFQYDPFNTKNIMMHDLVHDLAQSIMVSKVPGVQVERQATSTSNTKIRQVHLRTNLVAFSRSTQHDMDISSILTKFSHLRVLDASHTIIMKSLPSTVGNLKHLRFLNLTRSEICTLPNSLCNLWNLQILNLDYCQKLVALPRNMRHLKNLRHLFMAACISLGRMPSRIGELTCLKTLSVFIVGREKGNRLEELPYLNLGGELEIQHLERVRTSMDAQEANISEKEDLSGLSLEWESNSSSESRGDIDENVLEALKPPSNLQTLSIHGFRGKRFPLWMSATYLGNVVEIEIMDCRHCLHLPELGKLRRLKFLRLQNMEVAYIIEDENSIDILFPSLKLLILHSLPKLKGVLKEQVSTQVFPILRDLMIDSCSSLILPQLLSLKKLTVQNCGGLMLTSSAELDALTSLRVGFGEKMKNIPMEMLEKLSNLEKLSLVGAEEESLPKEGPAALKSLIELSIEGSETLRCLPVGWLQHLTSLKSLSVRDCQEFVELPAEIKDLKHLEQVMLYNVAKMVCLPKALCHISLLKELNMWNLPHLSTLPDWLDHLTSLQSLHIINCPKLVSLPPSDRGMLNLKTLIIKGCPELERRCKKGSGEDWHKISHIPQLDVN